MSLSKLVFIWKKKNQIFKITLPILTLVLSLIYLSSVTSAASSSNKLQPFPVSASCPSPDQPCVLGASSTVYQDIGSDVHISGNVGIGTSTPQVKLDVIGAINGQFGSNFGSFGTCCAAAQTPTLGLSEYTASNGRMAWLQFHDAGAQEAFLRLAKNTRTFEIGDSQNVGTSLAILTPDLSSRSILLSPNGEITSNLNGGYGQLRMVAGSYGAFFRNDGANTYFLLTNAGDQYGGWNGYRPLFIADNNGYVNINTHLCLSGDCRNAWPGGLPAGKRMDWCSVTIQNNTSPWQRNTYTGSCNWQQSFSSTPVVWAGTQNSALVNASGISSETASGATAYCDLAAPGGSYTGSPWPYCTMTLYAVGQ